MGAYFARRLLLFIPALFAVSFLAFYLSSIAPGDPAATLTASGEQAERGSVAAVEKSYQALRKKLNLDLPLFYFSVRSASEPASLESFSPKRKETILRFAEPLGQPEAVKEFQQALEKFVMAVEGYGNDSVRMIYRSILEATDLQAIKAALSGIEKRTVLSTDLAADKTAVLKADLQKRIVDLEVNINSWKSWIPVIDWHGTGNRYHTWISGVLTGDFGHSWFHHRPVSSVLLDALSWTVPLSLLAILFAYLLAVPVGVWAARKRGSRVEKSLTGFLFMIHSLPNFWIGTMMIVFLCGGDYLNLFPPFGIAEHDPAAGIVGNILNDAWHLVLPLVCWTYGSLAYLSSQVRGSMLETSGSDYVRTAKAKGATPALVSWKHQFRNAMLPLITQAGGLFPVAISGSIVIEQLFSIPGMGRTAYEAILSRDYPLLYALFLLSGLLTMTGLLVADVLYMLADPRIRLAGEETVNDRTYGDAA